jgi:hypothetical protein
VTDSLLQWAVGPFNGNVASCSVTLPNPVQKGSLLVWVAAFSNTAGSATGVICTGCPFLFPTNGVPIISDTSGNKWWVSTGLQNLPASLCMPYAGAYATARTAGTVSVSVNTLHLDLCNTLNLSGFSPGTSLPALGAMWLLEFGTTFQPLYGASKVLSPVIGSGSYNDTAFDSTLGDLVSKLTPISNGFYPSGFTTFVVPIIDFNGVPSYIKQHITYHQAPRLAVSVAALDGSVPTLMPFSFPSSPLHWQLVSTTTAGGNGFGCAYKFKPSMVSTTPMSPDPPDANNAQLWDTSTFMEEWFVSPPSLAPPPTRQKPRDDNLALGSARQHGTGKGQSSSVQYSKRTGVRGTYS